MSYFVIMTDVRRKFNLTLNEYAIAERISHLSFQKGWCDVSKDALGDFIGIKERSVFEIINKLLEKGLVVREERRLKVTDLWHTECRRSKFDSIRQYDFSRKVSIMEKERFSRYLVMMSQVFAGCCELVGESFCGMERSFSMD